MTQSIQKLKYILAACSSALLIGACSTPAASTETADAKPDPRQGKEVKQICFNQQIRNWRENDRKSVIVEKGLKEEYKLELIGTCQPDQAFVSIGLISRVGGGSCLSSGDRLITDARFNDGSCSIRRIYEWHKDADKPQAAEKTN
jgi:hypothetical protein